MTRMWPPATSYRQQSASLGLTVLGFFGVLALAAGCSTPRIGSSVPAASSVPATVHQLNARLATTTDFSDGIRANVTTSLTARWDAHPTPGPAFARAGCSNLASPLLALSDGSQPQLFGSTIMYKKLVQDIVDPISQEWQGAENLSIYQTSADATQTMTGLVLQG